VAVWAMESGTNPSSKNNTNAVHLIIESSFTTPLRIWGIPREDRS
jgi:hypothetical protein